MSDAPNRFTWVAVYQDGTRFPQINPDGSKNAYKDIDRDHLVAFEMWDGAIKLFSIPFSPTQRLIWRRRVEMSPAGRVEVCHIIGKQETVNGKNYQGVLGLFESDGHAEILGRFEENHPWLYPPVLLPEEGGEPNTP